MRSAQLETQKKKKTEEENDRQVRQIVMKITDPVIDKILNNKQPKNQKKLQRMLKIAGWDKYFTPIQQSALVLILRVIAVILAILIWSNSKVFAGIIFAFFGVLPSFLLKNSYTNHTDALMMSFPETIKIMSGYLSAGKNITEAVDCTIKSCAPIWADLFIKFRTRCNSDGVLDALDWFKEEVDISEAKEFFTTIRLTLELGGSAKAGFAEQADRIEVLLEDVMQKRIEKRKVWATAVQAPVFLCIMGAFALPVLGSFKDVF